MSKTSFVTGQYRLLSSVLLLLLLLSLSLFVISAVQDVKDCQLTQRKRPKYGVYKKAQFKDKLISIMTRVKKLYCTRCYKNMAYKLSAYDFCFIFQATRGSRLGWKWLLVLRRIWKRYCKIAWIHEVSWMDRSLRATVLSVLFASLGANSSYISAGIPCRKSYSQLSTTLSFNSVSFLEKIAARKETEFLCDYTNSRLVLII